jgi:hypothetical protein
MYCNSATLPVLALRHPLPTYITKIAKNRQFSLECHFLGYEGWFGFDGLDPGVFVAELAGAALVCGDRARSDSIRATEPVEFAKSFHERNACGGARCCGTITF